MSQTVLQLPTLRPFGVTLSIAIQKISIMGFSYDAEAKRAGFDLRRLQFKLFGNLRLGSISTQIASRLCWRCDR
jgi:hypothetical protein